MVPASKVEATNGQIDREGDDEDADAEDQIGHEVAKGTVLDHQYCTLRSTNRNCIAVSAMTMIIRITDCAAEPPRSPPRRPSA